MVVAIGFFSPKQNPHPTFQRNATPVTDLVLVPMCRYQEAHPSRSHGTKASSETQYVDVVVDSGLCCQTTSGGLNICQTHPEDHLPISVAIVHFVP